MERLKNSFVGKLLIFFCCYFLLAGVFYWIVADDWSKTAVATDSVNRTAMVGELTGDAVIEQTFQVKADQLSMLSLDGNVWAVEGNAVVNLQLLEGSQVLWEQDVPASQINPNGLTELAIDPAIENRSGHMATLRITANEGGLSFWYGNTRSAGKFDVKADLTGVLTYNGEVVDGELVLRQHGADFLQGTAYFWPVVLVIAVLIAGLVAYLWMCQKSGKGNLILTGIEVLNRYSYLLKQLVTRDFKVKYKASVLGVLWSFLNPLLMTTVYFFVFSTIFHNNIENFIVYLMSGIILFNYFSESTTLGLNAIVGNANLITKVYMPKYIYPISKVLSSSINMVISMIPLFLMMLVTGVAINKSLLLLPLVILFLVCFSAGVSMILSALTVFFRDMQFLWSVMVTMLNFLTPIFYPESIIPEAFLTLYHINPLYQICFFMRTIVLGGISPTPITYLYCALASLGTLAVGLWVFRKTQDKFALYL